MRFTAKTHGCLNAEFRLDFSWGGRTYGWKDGHVTTKFSCIDRLPFSIVLEAPLRAKAPLKTFLCTYYSSLRASAGEGAGGGPAAPLFPSPTF